MAAQCPLLNEVNVDRKGVVWEPGIPEQCLNCFRAVDSKVILDKVFPVPEWVQDPESFSDGSFYMGLKATGETTRELHEDTLREIPYSDVGYTIHYRVKEYKCKKLALGLDEC